MTLLRHEELKEAMAAQLTERLVIAPILDPRQVGAASVDVRLGTEFLLLKRHERAGLDPGGKNVRAELKDVHEKVRVPLGTPLWLHPGQFLLGSTLEFVRIPVHMAGFLIGRSSWARLGLVVETAGLVQPGYGGTLTYELANNGDSPLALYPGLRIAQLAVYRLSDATAHAGLPEEERYATKYLAAIGPEESKLAWEEQELASLLKLGMDLQAPL